MSEELIEELKSIANGLTGMCFDPVIHPRIRDYVEKQVERLIAITEQFDE